jgi:hypothetical protein
MPHGFRAVSSCLTLLLCLAVAPAALGARVVCRDDADTPAPKPRGLGPLHNPAAAPSSKPAVVPSSTPPTTPSRAPAVAVPAVVQPASPANSVTSTFVQTRPADAPRVENNDERAREQLGRLIYSSMDIAVDEMPLRDVLRSVRRALALNLVVFEATNGSSGIDGDVPISLTLEGATGREVLEILAGMSGTNATWQLHNATVEFGPRSVLARQEARRTAVYETTDLALDPPDFKSCGIGQLGVESYNRRDSDEIIGELVRMISTHCEPDAFLPPLPKSVEDASGTPSPVRHSVPSGPATGGRSGVQSPRKHANTTATQNFDPADAVVFVTGQWASIQAKDNNLVVLAPDFVHRAINGYPQPIPPRDRE